MILFAIMVAAVYVIAVLFIDGFNIRNWFYWAEIVACCIAVLLMLYKIISLLRNRIILFSDEIFVPGNWGEQKIQYVTNIKYSNIKDIYLIASNKDSNGKSVFGVFVNMPYLIFEEYSGDTKAVNVYYYSKKQVSQIIDIVVVRANEQGNKLSVKNGLDLINDFKNSLKK